MRYCCECKKEKDKLYCHFCKKDTNNNYVMEPLTEHIKLRLHAIGMTHKRPGFRRFLKKVLTGFQPSTNKEKYPNGVNRNMIVDRENNFYKEIVIDAETGEVFRDIQEPLDQHISNRKKSDK